MFYRFKQNNPGGFFDYKPPFGLYVYIEADSEDAAVNRAEEVGLYWNGQADGVDCSCCFDRWKPDPELIDFNIRKDAAPLPDITSLARYTANYRGGPTSVVYRDGLVKLFDHLDVQHKEIQLEDCKTDKEPTLIDLCPPAGYISIKDLQNDQGGELSINGEATFKKNDETFVFLRGDFKKIDEETLNFWAEIFVKPS